MTDEELSKLIGEFLPYPSKDQHYALRSFARIVAAAEREACAKVCEELLSMVSTGDEHMDGVWDCINAIRARGQG